jgi:hypothetical protein
MTDQCLLLLARADDSAIRTLQQQAPNRVVHASIADLSCAGWQYVSGRPNEASAHAGGRIVPASEIAAVLCRIPAVTPADLPHQHRDDRAYVAAEMNAFLRAWLAQFAGVHFNEPTWVSLAGPNWHTLTWARLVGELGITVSSRAQRGTCSSPGDLTKSRSLAAGSRRQGEHETATATVVCGEVFGLTDPSLIDASLRIASAVRANVLAVTFKRDDDDWNFLSAQACPELDSASAAALLRQAFARSTRPTLDAHAGVSCNVA